MASSHSNLSSPDYLRDCVVATSQKSINADLARYLQNASNKPMFTYLCFLSSGKNYPNHPADKVSLEGLLELSGGINPFDIPHKTRTNDLRITKLTEIRFVCAVRMQIGIPPGCTVDSTNEGIKIELPEPIVTLGHTLERVSFNMYCHELTIIKIALKRKGMNKSWKWFSQKPGEPWFVKTTTSLVVSALDHSLKTPYFDTHPEERDTIKQNLINVPDSAFGLQQLYFDLEKADVQTVPSFVGLTNGTVRAMLKKNFIDIWAENAKLQGLPLIGVIAVAKNPDGDARRLTEVKGWVNPVFDTLTRKTKAHPSPLELSNTTINYICPTDVDDLPGASKFSWDWIEPQDVAQTGGVIAIKRSTLAAYLANEMLDKARYSCIQPWSVVKTDTGSGEVKFSWGFPRARRQPTVTILNSGPLVAKIDHSGISSQSTAAYGELQITSTYSCRIVLGKYDKTVSPPVYFGGNTFTITQNLRMSPYIEYTGQSKSARVFDTTISDEFVISVDENGGLTTTSQGASTTTDDASESDIAWVKNIFSGGDRLVNDIIVACTGFGNASISPIPFNAMKNLVFPGAKVFSYKSASFSKYQDLICAYATYAANQVEVEIIVPSVAVTSPVPDAQDVIDLTEASSEDLSSEEGEYSMIEEIGKDVGTDVVPASHPPPMRQYTDLEPENASLSALHPPADQQLNLQPQIGVVPASNPLPNPGPETGNDPYSHPLMSQEGMSQHLNLEPEMDVNPASHPHAGHYANLEPEMDVNPASYPVFDPGPELGILPASHPPESQQLNLPSGMDGTFISHPSLGLTSGMGGISFSHLPNSQYNTLESGMDGAFTSHPSLGLVSGMDGIPVSNPPESQYNNLEHGIDGAFTSHPSLGLVSGMDVSNPPESQYNNLEHGIDGAFTSHPSLGLVSGMDGIPVSNPPESQYNNLEHGIDGASTSFPPLDPRPEADINFVSQPLGNQYMGPGIDGIPASNPSTSQYFGLEPRMDGTSAFQYMNTGSGIDEAFASQYIDTGSGMGGASAYHNIDTGSGMGGASTSQYIDTRPEMYDMSAPRPLESHLMNPEPLGGSHPPESQYISPYTSRPLESQHMDLQPPAASHPSGSQYVNPTPPTSSHPFENQYKEIEDLIDDLPLV
ncbi:hypothetical protein HYFRA_00005728 [Hymenoscyphus fraxineus]|uniref:Uncharacterized protein n=1 Tax=Hymenoscyphus fraxineus TaxID=746836 RepID=A0A9N9PQX7_9HELO|nr:hypothetical protein HYFRA_00005728 [Hymenoscyphus fraxineus]